VRFGHAELFGCLEGSIEPEQEFRPHGIAGASVDSHRLLADQTFQHDPIIRGLEGRLHAGQAADIVRVAIAATGLHCGYRLVRLVEQKGADLDSMGSGVVGNVQLEGRASYQAYRRAIQFADLGKTKFLADQKAFASVEVHRDLVETELNVAG